MGISIIKTLLAGILKLPLPPNTGEISNYQQNVIIHMRSHENILYLNSIQFLLDGVGWEQKMLSSLRVNLQLIFQTQDNSLQPYVESDGYVCLINVIEIFIISSGVSISAFI